nr:hypothetical protein [Tanacetum cinerariifolium]
MIRCSASGIDLKAYTDADSAMCTDTSRCMKVGGELWRMDGDGDGWTKVKDFSHAGNHPWTYDHEKIDMEVLALNFHYGKP